MTVRQIPALIPPQDVWRALSLLGSSLGVSLLLIYLKSIRLFMCGCWEMINGVVATNKYGILDH